MSPSSERLTGIALALCIAAPALGENADPAGDGSQYAWSENAGWINVEPLGDGGPGMQVDDFALSGWWWAENVGWISLSCANTGTCAAVAYGVTNDGDGALAGYAWSENAGWISFSCTNTDSCGVADFGVTIDPASGAFSGRAWGENLGWIGFSSAGPHPYGVETGWSCSTPSGSPLLSLGKSGGATELQWTSAPGWVRYDAIRGDLQALLSGAGDFGAATQACLLADDPATSLLDVDPPAPGEVAWFLVRAANCGGGTFDSAGAAQAGSRDAEIAASGGACP